MAIRFAVFIAVSLDGFIARADGSLDWLDPFHGEEHGYDAFFADVDALVIGRGTYDTVLAFPEWPSGSKRLIVCTSRCTSGPCHGGISQSQSQPWRKAISKTGVKRNM